MSAVDQPQYSTYIVSSEFRIIVELKSMLTEDSSLNFEDIRSFVKKYWQTIVFRIFKIFSINGRGAGNIVKNSTKITLRIPLVSCIYFKKMEISLQMYLPDLVHILISKLFIY
jgi:hypothetical protein